MSIDTLYILCSLRQVFPSFGQGTAFSPDSPSPSTPSGGDTSRHLLPSHHSSIIGIPNPSTLSKSGILPSGAVVKTFNCPYCSYTCNFKSFLMRHLSTHTGEKPFACEFCSYRCVQKGNLVRHRKTHLQGRQC